MPALSQSLTFKITNGNTTTNTVSISYPNTGTTTIVYTSERIKGDGYFSGSDGLHTVGYSASNIFQGTITMQATLASEPGATDWFDVVGTSVTYTSNDTRTNNTMDIYNFTGNFVWVRGNLSMNAGSLLYINYNH